MKSSSSVSTLDLVRDFPSQLLTFAYLLEPGDYVEADQIIAKIETDKVTVDIPSPKSGVITKYFAEVGDTVEVGADFYTIDTDAKAGSGAAATPPPKAQAPPAQAPPA